MFKKIKNVLVDQLKTGVSPEKLTDAVIAGALVGVFPLLGATTALAFLSGYFFKLNQVVIQAVNYLLYPVQLLMIPVYIKVVSLIFNVGDVPIRPDYILKKFNENILEFFRLYGLIALYAILLWIIGSIILFFLLRPLIVKFIYKLKGVQKWNG